MKHKGYIGNVEFSEFDKVFHGKIQDIDDLVTYEADTLLEIPDAFFEAVDDYIVDLNERELYTQNTTKQRPET